MKNDSNKHIQLTVRILLMVVALIGVETRNIVNQGVG